MAVNKVEYGGVTLIDLTEDTVTPQTLIMGATAHNRAGEEIEGDIEARTLSDIELNVDKISITVPKGYYSNAEEVNVDPFYDKGYDDGTDNGIEYIKTEEARTWRDVSTHVEVSNRTVEVDVSSGYYTDDTSVIVDVQEVYGAGHTEGWHEGYEEGLAAGGGGDEPYDPTTVWLINEVPVPVGLSTDISVLFISNGEEFVRILNPSSFLRYFRRDGTFVQPWNSSIGWYDTAYQTIAFPDPYEDIIDETLDSWLDTNATLISGSIGGEEEPLDDTGLSIILDQTQSPTVTVINAGLEHQYGYPVGIYGQRNDYEYTFDDYIEMEKSSTSSNPFTISAMNYTQLYAYLLLYVSDEANYEEFLQWLEVPPYGDNSVDFVSHINEGNPCEWIYEIRGVRFTKYAVEI